MGLDMYAYACNPEAGTEVPIQLHYWRKHNALHAWMEKLAIEKGLVKAVDPYEELSPFNCVPVPLTWEDLDRLEADIRAKKLIPSSGFFFGTTEYDPSEYMYDDLEFVDAARAAIANKLEVWYNSWW